MARGPERLHAGWEMSWRCPPGCGVQAPWQPGPVPQNPPQHLGILGPADNLGFGVTGFSWDLFFLSHFTWQEADMWWRHFWEDQGWR